MFDIDFVQGLHVVGNERDGDYQDVPALHGRQAALIAAGAVLMLFVAAILEGGFRQLVQSTALRLAIGCTVGALWLAYYLLAGREARR